MATGAEEDEGSHLKPQAGSRKKTTFGVNAFKLSKPASSKATLILPKQPPTGD